MIKNNKYKQFMTDIRESAYKGVIDAKLEILADDNMKEKNGETPLTKAEFRREQARANLIKYVILIVTILLFFFGGADKELIDSVLGLVSHFF